jgi:hypothetical protein
MKWKLGRWVTSMSAWGYEIESQTSDGISLLFMVRQIMIDLLSSLLNYLENACVLHYHWFLVVILTWLGKSMRRVLEGWI